jgi:hypothetical protein
MSCITYLHNDPFDSGGTKFISGTTCNGSVDSYNLNFGDSACMEAELPLVICDGLTISGSCDTQPPTPTPTTTMTPTPALCYVYEYINNSGNTIDVNGIECPSGDSYSLPVSPGAEGTTACLYQLSQGTIDAYAALGLILTQAAETCS